MLGHGTPGSIVTAPPAAGAHEGSVPDGPLPHENDRATFRDRVTQGAIATLQAWREEQAGAAAGA